MPNTAGVRVRRAYDNRHADDGLRVLAERTGDGVIRLLRARR